MSNIAVSCFSTSVSIADSATVCLYRPQCICTFQFDDVAQLPSTVSNEYGNVFTFPLHIQMGSLVFFFLLQYCKPHNVRANHNMQMGDQRGNCSNLFFCSFLFSLSDKPLSTLSLFFLYFFFVFVFAFLFLLSKKPFSTILGFGELSHAVLLVLSKKSKF